MIAETIKIEVDEDGFHLLVGVETAHFDFRLPDPETLYNEATGMIGPWLHERDQARGAVGPTDGHWDPHKRRMVYEHSDPKHPDHHDAMSAAVDSQS